ncbi:MAG: excinuclease ABC subunit UvrC [Mycoplasmatales bacterium]
MLLNRIKLEVPDKPGCYIYLNKNDEIIYIGKAKNLKNRMTSYFVKVSNIKTTKLVSEIIDFRYIVTNNEKESLILENNLIKEHSPRYNIMLKDDKTYPYIVITKEKYPRVLKVRDRKLRGDYYGPYPSASFVNDVIKVINRNTQLRQCHVLPKQACIYLHLKQCYGPCINDFSDDEVFTYRNEVSELLRNDMAKFKALVKSLMLKASSNLAFEEAQEYKNLLEQIAHFKERQGVEINIDKNFDVVEYYKDGNWIAISIINVRAGMVQNINLSMHSYIDDYLSVIVSYLYQYFNDDSMDLILTSDDALSDMIKNVFLKEVLSSHLVEYRNLETMGVDNAREYYKNKVDKITKLVLDNVSDGYEELKQMAGNDLDLIEMYDVSHLAGDAQVGVKISYLNGKKYNKLYRKYIIKDASRGDEYGSLSEMLERRVNRMIKENEKPPSLIILDGGKGQMSVAKEVLDKYGLLDSIQLIGLVKDKSHKTRAIINKNNQEMPLKIGSKLYKFLYDMQEEVHRFAIDFHHKSRSNSMIISELDKISGLGPKRKKILIEKFDNLENIKNASKEDFKKVGISDTVIDNIINYFSKKK